jgi:hypothetical protein
MAEVIEIEGKHYEIKGHDHNGTPIIKGHATTIHHTDENGDLMYDDDGNPVKSVHVSVSPVEEIKAEEQ